MTMFVQIGYHSALGFLRTLDGPQKALPLPVRGKGTPSAESPRAPAKSLVESLLEASGLDIESLVVVPDLGSDSLHLVVPDASCRNRVDGCSFHVWRPPGSTKSFYRVGSSVFASSPEACFLQMATLLPFADLVRVGFELCGRYALSSRDPRGFETRAMPLTTCVALRGYVDKARGMRGSKKARQALAFVAEGSASPMETALAMLLCLPRAQGGYGLPLPLLNHEVVLRSARKTAWKKTYCCDLFWPEGSLAVEYDSDMFHTGSKRIAHDSKRRNALLSAGIAVVTVTTAQIKDAREIDEIAVVLSQALGRRARTSMKGLMTRRHELRRLLFSHASFPSPESDGASGDANASYEYVDL